jgi:hypothetical protein
MPTLRQLAREAARQYAEAPKVPIFSNATPHRWMAAIGRNPQIRSDFATSLAVTE